jgi:hypothetical protein
LQIIRYLSANAQSREEKGETKKMKAYPTIFMKTKENESDKWAYPTMFMKTSNLIS